MIPTTADAATMSTYVGNIISVYRRATPAQVAEGRRWYREAHQLAAAMSGDDPWAGAGVLAALSPQTPWTRNIELARQAFATGRARGHTGNALAKAERIMRGEHPLTVLPRESKTWHFCRAIGDPDDPDAVVIDRHAHDIAVGERYGARDRGLSKPRRYALLARAYREAARLVGTSPSTVQAITWVVWREEN